MTRRTRRRLYFFYWKWVRPQIRIFPFPWWIGFFLRRSGLRLSIQGDSHGILLGNATFASFQHEKFLEVTRDALALIERHDPRRFHRVQKHIRYIINQELTSLASYEPRLHRCSIDFGKYELDTDDPAIYEWRLVNYAASIVHEATHGYLFSLYIPYTPRTRARIERMCMMEERRFAARIPSDRYDFGHDLISPFDEANWHSSWHESWWQGAKKLLVRIRKALREEKDHEEHSGQMKQDQE